MYRLALLLASAAAAAPVLRQLEDADCGQKRFGVAEDGAFSLTVVVADATGPLYNCSATMASVNATPDGECIDWPDVGDEPHHISLVATDAAGAVGACMEWELVPAGSADARAPSSVGLDQLHTHGVAEAPPTNGSGGHYEGRKQSLDQYLDSMTHLSYKCVEPGAPNYWPVWQWPVLAVTGRQWAFPPTAPTRVDETDGSRRRRA